MYSRIRTAYAIGEGKVYQAVNDSIFQSHRELVQSNERHKIYRKGQISMEGTIAGVLHLTSSSKEEDQNSKQLIAEIEMVIQSIDTVSARFDFESDPDLVEACIYEMQALAARYRYFTREARRLGITKSSLLCLKHMD